MYDQIPQSEVPQDNIMQRFFSQSWRAVLAEIVLLIVLSAAAGSAFDFFGPLDGTADAHESAARTRIADDFLQIARAYDTLNESSEALRIYERYLEVAGENAEPGAVDRAKTLRGMG